MDKYKIRVRRSIRIVLSHVYPNLKISKNALKLAESVFADFNKDLVESCLKTNQKGSVITTHVADQVIINLMSGKLRDYARMAANSCIAKYEAGVLVYKTDSKPKKKPKNVPLPPVEFTRSVLVLTDLVNPDVRLQKEAKNMVASILQQMCEVVVAKAQSTALDTLTVRDIIKAVDYCMAPNMTRMAIAEGTRSAMLFLNSH